MVTFIMVALAMVLLAIAMLALPLLRQRHTDTLLVASGRSEQNIVIARERLAEMEREVTAGELSQEEFSQARQELEQILLSDIDSGSETSGTAAAPPVRAKIGATLIGMVLFIPLLTLLLYWQVGSPELIQGRVAAAHGGASDAPQTLEAMIATLSKRLQESPEDAEGWYMLGRTLMAVEEYSRAVTAYERAQQLRPNEISVMLSLADAIAMANGGEHNERAAALVNQALAIDPNDSMALWMAGVLAANKGEFNLALTRFRLLLPQLEDAEEQQQVSQMMAALERKITAAGGTVEPAPATAVVTAPAAMATPDIVAAVGDAKLTVAVSLAPELQSQVTPGMTLFIYARAVTGPRFPLAAYRGVASELPLTKTLDESMAMVANSSLAHFSEVTLGARLSQSGDAIAKSGDLVGELSPVKVGSGETIVLQINRVVP
ncbi:MAG: c-type cytochrome biogenesis protein CcmI [Gammaproteobacteria bacterium]|nr:c-type cytochrome biogenesis protein CcmI [Gammaproteobacteria bacterium]